MIKDLTIVIVTFNSAEIIAKCLGYLNPTKYDIIVVDNSSADETCAIVSGQFPLVKLIKSGGNLGFGRANNIGLRQAVTQFALVLNPDAFILEEDIEIALNVLKNNPQISLASPTILHNEGASPKIPPSDGDYKETNFIVGGVLFMRLEVFKKIGFFDEDFFMFAEDNEISDRSIANGYKNVILNNATALHKGGGSSTKNLRNTYRRFWHLGWSKSKYKQTKKGKLQTIRATARLTIVYFCEGIFYFLTRNINKSVSKFAFSFGCFSYLIGLKAFKKNGKPRG
jgi:hypothetical protein